MNQSSVIESSMTRRAERKRTLGEEIANSVSHGIGLLAATASVPFLIMSAAERGKLSGIVGVSIFSASMLLVYLTSTLYHALPGPRAKHVLRLLDHSAIFVLIAGTYTPFTLGVLNGPWGGTLLGLVWSLALAGVLVEILGRMKFAKLSLVLYVAMGWLVVIAIRPMWLMMPGWGLFWLVAGGLAYTAGIAFYTAERVRHAHLVWHLFVIAGTACHVVAVLRYSA